MSALRVSHPDQPTRYIDLGPTPWTPLKGTARLLGGGKIDVSGNEPATLEARENIVATGRVALLLITPGQNETVRVNGSAWVTTDPALLQGFTLPRVPKSAIPWKFVPVAGSQAHWLALPPS